MRRSRAWRALGRTSRLLGLLFVAYVLLVTVLGARTSIAQPGTRHGLTSIKLEPKHVRRQKGDVQYLTATGRFADGNFRNITQRVEYRSSNPKVAVTANEPGEKSRIDLVGTGRAVISAVDPLTGVTSTDTGGDVTVRVGGTIDRVTITPEQAQRAVGEFQHFTAIGHSPEGGKVNVTQQVRYRTSDPSVALAKNLPGDRSRVLAVGPGTATITALHPKSGVVSNEATFTVLGALEKITLAPPHPRRALGEVQHYTATGHYVGGVTRNLTQQVEYTTSDAAVATAPNAEGNRSRIETVAFGTVTISARDPQTGISSADSGGDVQLTVYDPDAPKPTKPRTPPPASAATVLCGDASGDGAIGLSDPMWLLVGTTGLSECPLPRCDVDADGAVTLSDATAVAWVAFGYDSPLDCPR